MRTTSKAGRLPARPAALYRQVVEALRHDMLEGVFPVGAQLPTEAELCERFGVSRNTVRQALRELRQNGLVASRQGSGTTVTLPDNSASYVHDHGLLGDLYQYARTRYDYTVEIAPADAALAAKLECPPGEEWLDVAGCRYAPPDPTPIFWTRVHLRQEYVGVTRLLARGIPSYQLIEDLYGVRVTDVRQVIRGTTATGRVAAALGLAVASPVIEVERTYRVAGGRIIELTSNIYPFDRFHLTLRLLPGAH